MKLTHVITTLDPGGAENALIDLVKGLGSRGWQQNIVYLKGEGRLTKIFEELSVPVSKVTFEKGRDLFSALSQLKILFKDSPLVHSHLLKANSLASLSCGGPLIGSRHNDEAILDNPLISFLHKKLSNKENAHIAISEAVKTFYVEKGLDPLKFSVIPYGFTPPPTPQPADLNQFFESSTDGPHFLHAGRLVEQKGQSYLLEALSLYKEARLILCGEGPLEKTLKQQIQQLGLEDRVRLLGFRHDLPELMAGATAFVLPSIFEGLGRVLLEAMGVGCPIVATQTSAIPEVVDATAILVPPADPHSLATALEKSWQDRASRDCVADSQKKHLAEHFSMTTMLDRHESLYRKCMNE